MMKKNNTLSRARLANSLHPNRNTFETQRNIVSALLLAQDQTPCDEVSKTKREQRQIFRIEGGEVARLRKSAETDVLEPERGKGHTDEAAGALQRSNRVEIA